jgi:hypothetical protein
MDFLNSKEELELAVKALQGLLPYATIGQMTKGSKHFVAVISEGGKPAYVVHLKIEFNWTNKLLGSFSLSIQSSHELSSIADEMHAKKAVDNLLTELNFN